ncbi:MAG: MjaI family restriction endonuclease [Deltaproteobacteria bacterium]|nr:MjaI family restriction endonuclease [Deltaproteobacteria bacterium]
MKIKIRNEEVRRYLNAETVEFSKYAAPLINLANQYAQGTRPRVVGQMSELIQAFTGKTISEWEKWYVEQKPDAIRAATEKILAMIQNLKDAMNKIDHTVVEQWVKDLVIVKTFVGLKFQEAILKKGAELIRTDSRLSDPEEEKKGIDGFIGGIPVAIKPITYGVKASLPEQIDCKIIRYKKIKNGIEVDYGEIV